MEHSLGALAERLGAGLKGDPRTRITRVATLQTAGEGAISFFSNRRYKPHLLQTKAAAVILCVEDADLCPTAALTMDNPYLGYAKVAEMLSPVPEIQPGVHPSAVIESDVQIESGSYVGPNTTVGARTRIGSGVYIGPGCVIGVDCRIGDDSRLGPNVTLCHEVVLGRRVLLHPGVVIGADGFGIANDEGVWVKVPQLGGVSVGDDVEIGANTTVDRGALEDTVIECGVKLDNLIQVAHNVVIGEHTAIAGCVGIAGSVKIGKRCTIGGMSAINGHIEICDDAHVTGGSQVARSITRPGLYSSGMIAQENAQWRRMHARMRQLEDMARRLKALEEEGK